MGIAELLAFAPIAIAMAEKVKALIETAHQKGEITKEQMDAALSRKSASESRWDDAVKD
jgi:hypothetical protein